MFFLKNHSLQTKIAVILITMSIAITAVMSITLYNSIKYSETKSKEEEMINIANETANKIDRFIFERLGDIDVLANSFIILKDEISKDIKHEYLKNMINAYKIYEGIYITDRNNNVTIWNGREPLWVKDWKDKINKGEPYISDVLMHNNKKYICIAQPIIKENNKVDGAVVEIIIFDYIKEIVDNIKVGKEGRAYFVDQIADTEYLKKVRYMTENNQAYISVLYPVKKEPGQNIQWGVLVKQPIEEAFYILYDLAFFLIIFCIILILILSFISILLSKHITEPIKVLMDRMHGILNNLSKSNEDYRNRDEITKLTESFNFLIDEFEFMVEEILVKSGEVASIEEIKKNIDRFVSNIPNAIISFDSEGYIISFNKTAETFFEISAAGAMGKCIYNELPASLYEVGEMVKDSFRHDTEYLNHDIRVAQKEEMLNLKISTLIQKNLHNNNIGMTVVIRKLKDVEELEKSIILAEHLAALGEMSAGIAHEIKNPLSSIRGYAQYALMELSTDDEHIKQDLEIIINEVDRLNEIIERFLEFARPDEPDKGLCSITDIIKDTVNLCQKQLTEKNIQVIANFERIDDINVDYNQIKQVILNVLLNAIWASQEKGQIRISTRYIENENSLVIHITDYGCGIKEEDKDKIFKPFFTTNKNGKGLGLSICLRIIEKHGGVIVVDSEYLKGSTFSIKIPV